MTSDLDRRTYDILRLLEAHEPIGSVHLTTHLRERGYSFTERTVRLTLADLDDQGLTEKDGGKGRRLTPAGRAELERGNVSGRVDRVRERLAELTSRVTYDPIDDVGDVIVGTVTVDEADREALEGILDAIDRSPLGPLPWSITRIEGPDGAGGLEVAVPSSITLDGALLARGIDADLEASGVIEYHADPDPEALPYDDSDPSGRGGAILRFIDAIGGEQATFDVVSLLIEANRTEVESALAGDRGVLVADAFEFPLARYERVEDLATATRDHLGGVIDLRRPREPGPFPWGEPGWTFGSLVYAGPAECAIARCVEAGIAREWETLARTMPRSALESKYDVDDGR